MPDLSSESIIKLRLLHQKLPDMPEKMRAEAEKVIIGAFETLADMAERLLNLEGGVIELVSPQACKKHQAHILESSFGNFCKELEAIGCKWCLHEKNEFAKALADAVVDEWLAERECVTKPNTPPIAPSEVVRRINELQGALNEARKKKEYALTAYLVHTSREEPTSEESALSADLSSLPPETENPVAIDRLEASPADTAFLETSKNVRREICQATIIPPKECNAND